MVTDFFNCFHSDNPWNDDAPFSVPPHLQDQYDTFEELQGGVASCLLLLLCVCSFASVQATLGSVTTVEEDTVTSSCTATGLSQPTIEWCKLNVNSC